MSELFGWWPVALIVVAVIIRIFADRIDSSERVDRDVRVAMETVALMATIASAVGFALLFGRRIGL